MSIDLSKDESNKPFFKRKAPYVVGCIVCMVGFIAYAERNASSEDVKKVVENVSSVVEKKSDPVAVVGLDQDDVNKKPKQKLSSAEQIMQHFMGVRALIVDNQCYTIDTKDMFSDGRGSIVDVITTRGQSVFRYSTFAMQDGGFKPLERAVLSNLKTIPYFSKPITYYCMKGDVNISTNYYFKVQDFKSLGDFYQNDYQDAIKASMAKSVIHKEPATICDNKVDVITQKAC